MSLDPDLILVIDDFQPVRTLLCGVLKVANYHVLDAAEGREGLQLFRRYRPWLVITDIVMVGQEGIETIIELKRQQDVPKILAISGAPDMGRLSLLSVAASLGADAVLRKPFEVPELLRIVAALAAGSRDV
jgi:CheY-like chemotaxis protein